jgi:hypothetical protein
MATGLSKMIFETQLSIMKRMLKLGEFKFKKDTDEFKFYKEEVMNATYEGTKKLFSQMAEAGILERCQCQANMRHGWTECGLCAGSGFRTKGE